MATISRSWACRASSIWTPADLEQRFRSLSRQFHPDFFYNATPAERRASLERSSYLNDAYRTLRNPIARAEYLLGSRRVFGQSRGRRCRDAKVPATLLEEVFALNEELDEVRDLRTGGAAPTCGGRSSSAPARPIEAKQAAHEAELQDLSARWDALGARLAAPTAASARRFSSALRDCVLERNYINNLLEGIERELTQ